jgi:hypothetical protein
LSRVYGEKDAGGIITVEDCIGSFSRFPAGSAAAGVVKRVSKRRGYHENK